MDKRYQVFISSTFIDLIEARSEVMQALMELDCMPAGMELFPAANDDQWTWIKKVIDESDYYIVVVGGRYGSISPISGLSYTEMEYRYAIDQRKPVIGFLCDDPSNIPAKHSEQEPALKNKLESFRNLVKSRLCKFWSSPADLGAKVSRSITQLFKQYPAVGWIRVDQIPTSHSSDDVLKLRERIEQLESEAIVHGRALGERAKNLASGADKYKVDFHYKRKEMHEKDGRKTWLVTGEGSDSFVVTWNQIFGQLAPSMINGTTQWDMSQVMNVMAVDYGRPIILKQFPGQRFEDIVLSGDSLRIIKVHLRALGLITLSDDSRWWFLTEYGDDYMTQLLAAPKPAIAPLRKRRKS